MTTICKEHIQETPPKSISTNLVYPYLTRTEYKTIFLNSPTDENHRPILHLGQVEHAYNKTKTMLDRRPPSIKGVGR